MDVWRAFVDLWTHEGLGQELIVSFLLHVQAMAWATLISLGLAYLTVVPVFQPIALAVSKGRFLGMVGLTFFFTIIFSSGHRLKVSLLVFGVAVFFVTSMIDVVAQIPKEKFDLARTLRMGDRKSTRLNSSHVKISYAVFCLKKKSQRCISKAQCRK